MTAKGVGPLVFYDGRMNGRNYSDGIKHELEPYVKKDFNGSDPWHYVQDSASYHKSEFSMNWFNENKINVSDWPASITGLQCNRKSLGYNRQKTDQSFFGQ